MRVLLLPVLLAALTACGGNTATCAVCAETFTDADCQAIADVQGCASGVAFNDPECGNEAANGCSFTECESTGVIECALGGDDSAADSGTEAP